MKTIACAIWYTIMCVLRFVLTGAYLILFPIHMLVECCILTWRLSLSKWAVSRLRDSSLQGVNEVNPLVERRDEGDDDANDN